MSNYFYIRYTNDLYVNDTDGAILSGWHPEEVIPFSIDPNKEVTDFPGKEFVSKFTKEYPESEVFPFRADNVYIDKNGKTGYEYICYVEGNDRVKAISEASHRVILGMKLLEKEKVKQLKETAEKFKEFKDLFSETKAEREQKMKLFRR